jgi:hypothetical protein
VRQPDDFGEIDNALVVEEVPVVVNVHMALSNSPAAGNSRSISAKAKGKTASTGWCAVEPKPSKF